MNNNEYCVVLTTFANMDDAKIVIDHLLSKELAACIQCFPIQSYYTWKGKVENDNEIALFIKTKSDVFERVESEIKANHPYETPEIILIPIKNGSAEYLGWMNGLIR